MKTTSPLILLVLASQALAGVPEWLGRRAVIKNEALSGATQNPVGLSASKPTSTVVPELEAPAATPTPAEDPAPVVHAAAVTTATPTPAPKVVTVSKASTTNLNLNNLLKMGLVSLGINSKTPTDRCWIGKDGPNVLTITNNYSDGIYVVGWAQVRGIISYIISFVNAEAPVITVALNPGETTVVSCTNQASGGFAAIYPDTVLSQYGQIQNTWFEYTFGSYGTIDISKEVYMAGHPISSSSAVGIADMDNCYFKCKNGALSCKELGTYGLYNCPGIPDGVSDGGLTVGPSAAISISFS